MKKNALLLFTKYPQPGVTKTRLIEENGGALTPEQAAELYRAMVLDTAEVGLHALERCRGSRNAAYDLYVSSSPEEDLPKVEAMFRSAFPRAEIGCICDRGSNFDEHFNDSYRQLFAKGYDSVICIGGDLPCITPDLIVRSFDWLTANDAASSTGAMVLAPCQAAGVSLVGVTRSAGVDFTGVFYNTAGVSALDALIQIAQGREIPTALYEALFDVDYMEDLAHIMAVINATAYTAQHQPEIKVPERTSTLIAQLGLVTSTPPNTSHDPRSRIDG
ncbi:TIGR04282 family arsenosugar biosynthesis glycosyltransferase [Geomonas azotofigens]|uniref:TIGR04282 family arsenosugar biosynthesis glycosyltransferase n=1 Tax=Geomonas azotofigens TaxID=2843196 RepID=UPI001C120301|nr:DUF2064 domain-containing protein [Geomonas azotofigens]MBU5613857.1 DUF2064 domain-containing protein [Geomonas azotofigens]